jgi:predicted small secreted protein
MNTRTIVVTATLLTLLAGMLVLTGCNTYKGAGKDIEKTGESMQGK